MGYKYSVQGFDKDHMARAVGVSLPISTKQSIEICNYIRNKTVERAKQMLSEVIEMKKAVPFNRFNRDMGHKPGIAAGRYPIKACSHILDLVKQVEANAQFKGLNTSLLVISHINAQGASRPYKGGRKRAIPKRCHVEIAVQEMPEKAKEDKKKSAPKKKEDNVKEKVKQK